MMRPKTRDIYLFLLHYPPLYKVLSRARQGGRSTALMVTAVRLKTVRGRRRWFSRCQCSVALYTRVRNMMTNIFSHRDHHVDVREEIVNLWRKWFTHADVPIGLNYRGHSEVPQDVHNLQMKGMGSLGSVGPRRYTSPCLERMGRKGADWCICDRRRLSETENVYTTVFRRNGEKRSRLVRLRQKSISWLCDPWKHF